MLDNLCLLCGYIAHLKVGDLSSVQEAGLGLYLAYAVLQIVSSSILSSLRRSSDLQIETVNKNNLSGVRHDVIRVRNNVVQMEAMIDRISSLIVKLVVFFVVMSVLGLVLGGLFGDYILSCFEVQLLVFFYAILPLVSFVGSVFFLSAKHKNIRTELNIADGQINEAIMRKP